MVTSISGKSVVKGLIGAVLGLIMATIGMNSLTGTPRFTFGSVYLMGGIAMIPTPDRPVRILPGTQQH